MSVTRPDRVQVDPEVFLAVDHIEGSGRPFVLVHGLASNRRLWDGVAHDLSAAGHEVAAVDLRGHGESDGPATGYDTETAARDVAAVIAAYDMSGDRRPIVAGQSWGGQVVVRLADSRSTDLHALALVDGGWFRLQGAFPDWETCAAILAPPDLSSVSVVRLRTEIAAMHANWEPWALDATLANLQVGPDGRVLARLSRAHHMEILRSMWEHDPREDFRLIQIPVLLMPAYGDTEMTQWSRRAVVEATALLADARVSEYVGGDHDLHAEQPARVARDLLSLVEVT